MEIKHEELPNIAPIDVVGAITTGATIVNATLPFITDLFKKISEFFKSIQTDSLSMPKGKRKAIEDLQKVTEARNEVQKAYNKLNDEKNAQYDLWFAQLKEKGVIV